MRYFLPAMPFFFLPAAMAFRGTHRGMITALVVASIASNVLPSLINPGLVIFSFRGANRAIAKAPWQHYAALMGIVSSMHGQPYPDYDPFYYDGMGRDEAREESLNFPNSWTVNLIRDPEWRGVGIVALLILLTTPPVLAGLIVRGDRDPAPTTMGSQPHPCENLR
jgi:hypothetical protein